MYDEVYKAVERFFRGPSISHHNRSIPSSLKEYLELYYEIQINSRCYSETLNDFTILTYDDSVYNIGLIFDQCFIDGKPTKILAFPLYQSIEEAAVEDVLTFIAIAITALVASLDIRKTVNTFPYKENNFSDGMNTIYCYAPMVIYCAVTRDIFHRMFSIDVIFEQFEYVITKFFNTGGENSILYGTDLECFMQSWENRKKNFAEIYNLMSTYYSEDQQEDGLRTRLGLVSEKPSFIYKYLDCSMLLAYINDKWKNEKISLFEMNGDMKNTNNEKKEETTNECE